MSDENRNIHHSNPCPKCGETIIHKVCPPLKALDLLNTGEFHGSIAQAKSIVRELNALLADFAAAVAKEARVVEAQWWAHLAWPEIDDEDASEDDVSEVAKARLAALEQS